MKNDVPTEMDLSNAIRTAAGRAIFELFDRNKEHFYYITLITTGEAHPPVLAAWSDEALENAVADTANKEDARWGLKWSYADSPYYCFGQEYFVTTNELFAKRPEMQMLDSLARQYEYDLRLRAMETAMAELDNQGLFGSGHERNQIVVNVEVMPPDYTNVERAIRLNPSESIRVWLAEAAEFPQ